MTRTETIEMLLRLSQSLEIKETELKKKLYNIILVSLELFEILSKQYHDPDILSNVVIQKVGQIQDVPSFYNTTKIRKREYVVARQIAMVFIKRNTKLRLVKIGKKFGNRDHATVLYACKTVDNLIDTDHRFRYNMKYISMELQLKY